jgi:hypothetical protein
MPTGLAFSVVTWVALVILYLGLAATLHRVRLLSAELAALRVTGNARAGGIDIELPALADPEAPAARLVVAADTGCPACHMTVDGLVALAPQLATVPILLTWEQPEVWQDAVGHLDIRRDPGSWRAVAHLSPPILLTIDPQGRVTDLALPTSPDDLPRTLAAWGFRTTSTATVGGPA